MHSSQQARSSKVISLFVALALAFGMVGFVSLATPSNAYADENSGVAAQSDSPTTTGYIAVQTTQLPVAVEAGNEVNLTPMFSVNDTNGTWHVDYKITSTDGTQYGSVNKHSGIFTGLAATPDDTTVTVTAYLQRGPAPTGNKNNPCSEAYLSKASLTVEVTPTTTYGFQGTDNAVKMITPTVTSYSGSVAAGYKNITSPVVNKDGYYYFTFETIAGFRTYNTPEKYADYNKGNISVTNALGVSYTLNGDNTGEITISDVNVNAQQITVKVAASAMPGARGTLNLSKNLKANNASRVLGADLAFQFTGK